MEMFSIVSKGVDLAFRLVTFDRWTFTGYFVRQPILPRMLITMKQTNKKWISTPGISIAWDVTRISSLVKRVGLLIMELKHCEMQQPCDAVYSLMNSALTR